MVIKMYLASNLRFIKRLLTLFLYSSTRSLVDLSGFIQALFHLSHNDPNANLEIYLAPRCQLIILKRNDLKIL